MERIHPQWCNTDTSSSQVARIANSQDDDTSGALSNQANHDGNNRNGDLRHGKNVHSDDCCYDLGYGVDYVGVHLDDGVGCRYDRHCVRHYDVEALICS